MQNARHVPRHKNIKEAKLLKDGYLDKGIKKGVPLYSNLVNLKSNTMKNTMQRYGFFTNMQYFECIKCNITVIC
ncbi:hypothetical protein ACU52_00035 [Xylanibacter rarus]|uniref:Uncharacterized protein n=1 Tax=Xylanibacter rarus TaxID=1676614 RepID=A0A8E1QZG1_9BACT|nr:hypothetical protein ACU52_00035 [Xylanibacter rarus]